MRKKIKLLSVILCVLALTGCNKSSQNELTISVATSLLNPINEIIKEKRLALGYTQEQLAKFLNLTTPAVNKWERGVSQTKRY